MPLDPEVAAYLESQAGAPPRSALDISSTREVMRRNAALTGPAPVLAHTEDLQIAGKIPGRQYWPKADATLPLIVYFHGGRFISGDLESHDPLCRKLACSTGFRVLAIDYRLSPEHRFPAAAEDASEALKWALGQGFPVAVMGDSAGANLAAVAAIEQRGTPELKAQVLVYPMMDASCSLPSYQEFSAGYGPGAEDMQRGWREYLEGTADLHRPQASPLFADDLRRLAPAFVLTAEYDTLRDEGEAYARKLEMAGVLTTLRRYSGAIHGFFTMQGVFRVAQEALAEVATFLREHLNERPDA